MGPITYEGNESPMRRDTGAEDDKNALASYIFQKLILEKTRSSRDGGLVILAKSDSDAI
jgi:hypothetical protein